MAGREAWIGPKRGHLLAAHSGRHRPRRAESHRVLTTREEATIGTWLWPKLNSRQVIGSRPRTTTSTPSIISECPRIEERHSGQRSHLPAALESCLISAAESARLYIRTRRSRRDRNTAQVARYHLTTH